MPPVCNPQPTQIHEVPQKVSLLCCRQSSFPPSCSQALSTHRDAHIHRLLSRHQLADGFVRLLLALVLKSLGGQLLQRLLELLVVDDAGCLPSASTNPRLPSSRPRAAPPDRAAAGQAASGRARLCPPAASGPSPTSEAQLRPGQSWLQGPGWAQPVLSSTSSSARCCYSPWCQKPHPCMEMPWDSGAGGRRGHASIPTAPSLPGMPSTLSPLAGNSPFSGQIRKDKHSASLGQALSVRLQGSTVTHSLMP